MAWLSRRILYHTVHCHRRFTLQVGGSGGGHMVGACLLSTLLVMIISVGKDSTLSFHPCLSVSYAAFLGPQRWSLCTTFDNVERVGSGGGWDDRLITLFTYWSQLPCCQGKMRSLWRGRGVRSGPDALCSLSPVLFAMLLHAVF